MKTGMFSLVKMLVAAAIITALALPGAAMASSKGRLNTTIGLGALTVHQALKGKKTNALILGAGTAYAYKRYSDARKDEKRRRQARTIRTYRYSRVRR